MDRTGSGTGEACRTRIAALERGIARYKRKLERARRDLEWQTTEAIRARNTIGTLMRHPSVIVALRRPVHGAEVVSEKP